MEGEFNSILGAQLGFLSSLDHFLRTHDHHGRNGQTSALAVFRLIVISMESARSASSGAAPN
jgi:hypothetical protein